MGCCWSKPKKKKSSEEDHDRRQQQNNILSVPEAPPQTGDHCRRQQQNNILSVPEAPPQTGAGSGEPTAVSEQSQAVVLQEPSSSPLPPKAPPRPKKRALLCGVSYRNSKYELKGTLNDVNIIRDLLINSFGFLDQNLLILTEEKEDPEVIPTRKNIEKGLQWLVEGCSHGDSLVFYFAGHGSVQQDSDDDETDGYDETICPVDFLNAGQILDDYINSTIVGPLTEGVTLHAIVDACHSGTILDLSHVFNFNTKRWDDNSPLSKVRKGTDGGLAISISACEDHQKAVDTSEKKSMNGAMTLILTQLVKERPGLSYGDLFDLMNEAIEVANTKKEGCLQASTLLRTMFGNRISQKPQLSSSGIFDVYKRHFQL